jgi:universal stress protein A
MFERILCPIDFGDNSLEALFLARRLPLRDEGRLSLLHVVPPTDSPVVSAPRLAQHSGQESLVNLKTVAAEDLVGVAHETLMRFGHPAAEVMVAAKEVKADLIVMATHGRHGISHLVLGSVAEKVVRESACPVLTLRIHERQKQAAAPAA